MMTINEVNARIEAIENNPFYQSAEMADRLQGAEKEEYEKMCAELAVLYTKRAELKRQTKEYWEEVLARQEGYVAKWTAEKEETDSVLKKYNLTKSIEEAQKTIEMAKAKIAEF